MYDRDRITAHKIPTKSRYSRCLFHHAIPLLHVNSGAMGLPSSNISVANVMTVSAIRICALASSIPVLSDPSSVGPNIFAKFCTDILFCSECSEILHQHTQGMNTDINAAPTSVDKSNSHQEDH
jgi:hypothetical protein